MNAYKIEVQVTYVYENVCYECMAETIGSYGAGVVVVVTVREATPGNDDFCDVCGQGIS